MRKVGVNELIRTSPANVIDAFLDEAMLRDWWKVERSLIERREGGIYTLAWNISESGFGFVTTGIITTLNPGGDLVIEKLVYLNPVRNLLGPMKLTIRVTGNDEGTQFYLCQDGYNSGKDWDWYYDAVRHAWPQVTNDLKTYLEDQATIRVDKRLRK